MITAITNYLLGIEYREVRKLNWLGFIIYNSAILTALTIDICLAYIAVQVAF